MPRAATSEAQKAQSTAGTNAAQYGSNAASLYGPLTTQANSLVNSPGYSPATLGAITNAGMGASNAAFTGAAGQIQRQAAKTGNQAVVPGALDTLAMEKGIAGGQEAGSIQEQNANFQNQQRLAGLSLLSSMYGTNVNAQTANEGVQTGDINAQTQASPGWAQTFSQVLSGIGSALSGGAAAKKACWIAAKVFDGWDDPRTILVRTWLFQVWGIRSWIGNLVTDAYLRFGEKLSENKVAVAILKPLFLLALRKARKWQTQKMMS